MLKLSDHDGLKNPEEMNPSSQSLIPSKEGQERKCHCYNVPGCVWGERLEKAAWGEIKCM